eukprot:1352878-Prorocentrum_lima.AAC.1
MKCALTEMCRVLKAAFGPAFTREIAAELTFNTFVLGASRVSSPRLSSRFVPVPCHCKEL